VAGCLAGGDGSMDSFFVEREFRERAGEVITREILFDCEERGVSGAEAMRMVSEVADRMREEEEQSRCAPESRVEIQLRAARESLLRAGEILETLKKDFGAFKRAIARGEF
jgi:hypothetical protein